MKRIISFFFAFLTIISLCVPTMAISLEDLPPLDMDNTTIEYDFERVFLKEYSVNNYLENPLKTQPELITMAEKGYSKSSNVLRPHNLPLKKNIGINFSIEDSLLNFYGTATMKTSFNIFSVDISYLPSGIYTFRAQGSISDSYFISRIWLDGNKVYKNLGVFDYKKNVVLSTFDINDEIKENGLYLKVALTVEPDIYTEGNIQFDILEGSYTLDTIPDYKPYNCVNGDYGLYFYIYNPSRLSIVKNSAYNQINIMSYVSKFGDVRHKYQLKLIDTYGAKDETETHTDALILKFSLLNYDDFVFNEAFKNRNYDISEFELLHDDNVNAKAYPVAQKYMFTKVNGFTTATTEKTETVRIEKKNLAFAYYRSQASESIDEYHDLQSVFFTIPDEYEEEYGELVKVSAVWEECLSKPILIINNSEIINDFQEALGKEVPTDFPYTFGYDFVVENVGFLGLNCTFNYLYNPNNKIQGMIFDSSFDNFLIVTKKGEYYNNLINKLYLSYYSEDVFSDEDKEIVTREELESDLDKYKWADECFVSINDTNFENPVEFDSVKINNFTYYRNSTFWELFNCGSFAKDKLDFTNLKKVNPNDLKTYFNEEFKENYLVSSDFDAQKIRLMYTNNVLLSRGDMYALYFADTSYITHKIYMFDSEGKLVDCDAMVVQPTAIRNFDFIDLTYNKNGVITIIPVVGSPQNTIPGITPNPNYAEPDRWAEFLEFLEKILPVVLALIVISIVLRAYQIFKRPKIIIKDERKKKE